MVDLVQWYFGPIKEIKTIKKNTYSLNKIIKSDNIKQDAENYIFLKLVTESDVFVDIEADLVSKEFVQFFEVNSKNFNSFCSIQPNIPLFIDNKIFKNFEFNNLYISQIEYFLNCIDKKISHTVSTLEESVSICNCIDKLKLD